MDIRIYMSAFWERGKEVKLTIKLVSNYKESELLCIGNKTRNYRILEKYWRYF